MTQHSSEDSGSWELTRKSYNVEDDDEPVDSKDGSPADVSEH